MIKIRKSNQRGHADHGWLDTYHTFSFGDYHDPNQMGFSVLRVINEDFVQSGKGFGTHPHRDMEIITYVLEGALEHKDSMGTGSVIKPGDIQYMSAGTGVTHSEFNHSASAPVHLLQIWILPNIKSASPQYAQKFFDEEAKKNKFCLLISSNDSDGAIAIRQDIKLFASVLEPQKEINYEFKPQRKGWIQVARGNLKVNGEVLSQGDGASVTDEQKVSLVSNSEKAEILFFDLPE